MGRTTAACVEGSIQSLTLTLHKVCTYHPQALLNFYSDFSHSWPRLSDSREAISFGSGFALPRHLFNISASGILLPSYVVFSVLAPMVCYSPARLTLQCIQMADALAEHSVHSDCWPGRLALKSMRESPEGRHARSIFAFWYAHVYFGVCARSCSRMCTLCVSVKREFLCLSLSVPYSPLHVQHGI